MGLTKLTNTSHLAIAPKVSLKDRITRILRCRAKRTSTTQQSTTTVPSFEKLSGSKLASPFSTRRPSSSSAVEEAAASQQLLISSWLANEVRLEPFLSDIVRRDSCFGIPLLTEEEAREIVDEIFAAAAAVLHGVDEDQPDQAAMGNIQEEASECLPRSLALSIASSERSSIRLVLEELGIYSYDLDSQENLETGSSSSQEVPDAWWTASPKSSIKTSDNGRPSTGERSRSSSEQHPEARWSSDSRSGAPAVSTPPSSMARPACRSSKFLEHLDEAGSTPYGR